MYKLLFHCATTVAFPTLGHALAHVNDMAHQDLLSRTPAEMPHSLQWPNDQVFALTRHSSGIGFESGRSISLHVLVARMMDEIMPFMKVVPALESSRTYFPWEMCRQDWGAFSAIGSVAYGLFPALGASVAAIHLNSEGQSVSPTELLHSECRARFGFGHNGPVLPGGAGTNSRHEVHVALALCQGRQVPEQVQKEYRALLDADTDCRLTDPAWDEIRFLLDHPMAQGLLTEGQLITLITLQRYRRFTVKMTDEGVLRELVGYMRKTAPEGDLVGADDLLSAHGFLKARKLPPMTEMQPAISEDAMGLARACAEDLAVKTMTKIREDRAKMQITQREFDYRMALAKRSVEHPHNAWANSIYSAIASRDAALLLKILDCPGNESTKRYLKSRHGVDLLACRAADRPKLILSLIGIVDASECEATLKTIRLAADEQRKNQELVSLASQARAENVQCRDGVVMDGAAWVEAVIADGYSRVACVNVQGSKRKKHCLIKPGSSEAMPFKSTSPLLAYARALTAKKTSKETA